MRDYARPVIVGTIAISTLFPLSALAQSIPEPQVTPGARLAAAPGLSFRSLGALGGATIAQRRAPGDPVSNGIVYGALIGAGTGLALMAYLYNVCDGSCDAPEPAPMYLSAAGMGAAVGAVAGWAVDAARKSSARRVAVGAVMAPRRQSVSVAVRF